jgi:integrase
MFYVRKFRAGKGELFRSTGEKRRVRAQTIADKMMSDWLGHRQTTGRRLKIADACEELLEVLEQEFMNGDRRKRTFDHDKTYAAVLTKLFGDIYVDEFDEDFWDGWVRNTGKKLDRKLGDISKYVSKLLTYCHRKGRIVRKPKIKNPDVQLRRGRVFNPEEIAALFAKADIDLKLQIVLGFENGMRPGEVRGLQWDMVEWGPGWAVLKLPIWLVKTGPKYGHGREIQISERAYTLLRERFKAPGRNPKFVFPAPKEPFKGESDVHQARRFKRACKAAGIIGPARQYDLRHSFYTISLLEKRMPIQLVSEFGGTAIGTLQRHYLHGDAKRTATMASAVTIETGGTDGIREKK